jgi:hypothetical protein
MASQYLLARSSTLQAQTPVSPAGAQAAQIPLQTFHLPVFPPAAFTSNLSALILTSDINLSEYTSLLTQPFSIPSLPPTITNLTLELFSLGYPPGFLTALGTKLPHLKSVTLYSQLFAGTTPATREDALGFVRAQGVLIEVHLLDVFAPSGFFTDLTAAFSPSLRFLEINYTYRHSDPGFLGALRASEIVGGLVGVMGLLGLTLSLSAPDVSVDDEDDGEGKEIGVKVIGGSDARDLVGKVILGGDELVMIDVTMFELDITDVEMVLDGCEKINILGVSVGLENGWEDVVNVLGKKERRVEVLEIVGVPGEGLVEKWKGKRKVGLSKEVLGGLSNSWKGLKSVKVSILRTNVEQWVKEGDNWERKG